MSNSAKNVSKERRRWTKAERQYIQGIVHNLSLQRLTDQEIVQWLHDEKKIDVGRSTVTTIKNQFEQAAGNWYLELRESGSKAIAFYKERLDSLLSYQKKLHDIISASEKPEVHVRAISELHGIEMSLFSLFNGMPRTGFNINSEYSSDIHTLDECNCPTSADRRVHCKCRHCGQVWCATTENQDWCPNPDCSSGIKGCHFKPYDEHYDWIQCTTCQQWFKKPEILERHNCVSNRLPKAIDESDTNPITDNSNAISKKSLLNDTEVKPEMQPVSTKTMTNEEPEEESEVDRYWRTHKLKPRPKDNTVHFSTR